MIFLTTQSQQSVNTSALLVLSLFVFSNCFDRSYSNFGGDTVNVECSHDQVMQDPENEEND